MKAGQKSVAVLEKKLAKLEAQLREKTEHNKRLSKRLDSLCKALHFYADPETYLGIGFFPDRPCGEFINDFNDTHVGKKPGRVARQVMEGGKLPNYAKYANYYE